MRAIILAAGKGRRMVFDGVPMPKLMLSIAGKTLLRRHIEILRHCGVDEIVVAVGYRRELIYREIAAMGASDWVETVYNPEFEEGSIVTLWSVREQLLRGGDVILMDGDVLYDHRIMDRLLQSGHGNCFLLDRDFELGEEPTKLCVRDGHLVEFHKVVNVEFDFWGESVGFFRLTEDVAHRLVPAAKRYLDADMRFELYDQALRDLLLTDSPGTFGFEEISGLPWTEIDFQEDVMHAVDRVLPELIDHSADSGKVAAGSD